MSEIKEAITTMANEKGIPVELVVDTLKQTILATFKRKFGTDENALVEFSDDLETVSLYSKKIVVEEENYYNEVTEIPLDEAQELDADAEVGDELRIPLDLKNFDRISIQSGKQRATQSLRDFQKDAIYTEFKKKEGEIIYGYYQNSKDGDCFIDLGRTQGILPRKNQSPLDNFEKNDRVRVYVESVRQDDDIKKGRNVRVVLSRVHENFVRKLLELNVPELVGDNPSIEIIKIVREAGMKTKVAVYPKRNDVDAVGTCVGLKGVRVQAIISELDGERVDILKWDPNPAQFIANALSPAKVSEVYILDEDRRHAVAVVDENQLAWAIGRGGINIRLVNRLCDWNVEAKTKAQFLDMDVNREVRSVAESMFTPEAAKVEEAPYQEPAAPEIQPEVEEELDGVSFSDFEDIDQKILKKLHFYDVYTVEEYMELSDEEKSQFDELSKEDRDYIDAFIESHVEFADEEDQEVVYSCPTCGAQVTEDMTECPSCHTPLAFN
ncbi:MAG: transcription termination factor NusA [Sphaerochaetaceae bacterium]|nr:transcription termination factor NusA [Sphaerochaetaceae bacterium]